MDNETTQTQDARELLLQAAYILVNTSAGKDSQAMMHHVVELARELGLTDKLVAVHCDLGRVEWQGTLDLAREHAEHYGMRFEVVSRKQGDLLAQFTERRASLDAKGKFDAPAFPSSAARYCTSDHKTNQVKVLQTQLANEYRAAGGEGTPIIVDCLGLRAEESPARAKKVELELSKSKSSGKKTVWTWLPILDWDTTQVWDTIKAAGTRHHWAYDKGMERLSCVFCVFASKDDLKIAGRHNRNLLDLYVQAEVDTRGTFKANLSLAQVRDELDAEEKELVTA